MAVRPAWRCPNEQPGLTGPAARHQQVCHPQRNEPDAVEILSGVYEGRTTGTPIGLLIRNQDQRSKDYGDILQTFRPGHADYAYWHKYGLRDPRGGGRSSASPDGAHRGGRCRGPQVAGRKYGTQLRACMTQLGELEILFEAWEHVPNNPSLPRTGRGAF